MVYEKVVSCFFLIFICAMVVSSDLAAQNLGDNVRVFRAKDFEDRTQHEDSLIQSASVKALNIDQAPGSITVFSGKEILAMGARDLIDVIGMVPGFQLCIDVQGVVSVGVRGQPGMESTLLMVDGIEMNEPFFLMVKFGGRYPLATIERIEFIRGPGVSIYGGYGALALIHIITKASKPVNHLQLTNSLSVCDGGLSARRLNALYMQKFDRFHFAVSGGQINTIRSNKRYKDSEGSSYLMTKESNLNSNYIKASAAGKYITGTFFFEEYKIATRDQFIALASKAYPLLNTNLIGRVGARYPIGPKFSLLSAITFAWMRPWEIVSEIADEDTNNAAKFQKTNKRISINSTGIWQIRPDLNLSLGVGAYRNRARCDQDPVRFFNGSKTFQIYGVYSFAQAYYTSKIMNVHAGVRVDKQELLQPVIAPRISFNKGIGSTIIKVNLASGIRLPAIENLNLAKGKIKQQETRTYEVEVRQNFRHSTFALTAFRVMTLNPIVYGVVDDITEIYFNGTKYATQGLEASYRLKLPKVQCWAEASFYTNKGLHTSKIYSVPGRNQNLAYAPFRVSGYCKYAITEAVFIGASANIESRKYYNTKNEVGLPVYKAIAPSVVLNSFVDFDLPIRYNFAIRLGVSNILDQRIDYAQPYNSFHNPLPGMGREFNFSLMYNL